MILDEIAPFKICVNLPHRKDRRDEAWAQFAKLGMSVMRFPAIPSHRVKSTWGYKSPSRYACSLSKRLAIRTGKLAGASAVLLMEDDVVLADDLHERLAEIEVPEDWGILFLGCRHSHRPVPVSSKLVRVTRAADNHAVIIRLPYYNQALKGLSGICKNAKSVINFSDVKLSGQFDTIPTYACFPNLAWQKETFSDNSGKNLCHYNQKGQQTAQAWVVSDLEKELAQLDSQTDCIEDKVASMGEISDHANASKLGGQTKENYPASYHSKKEQIRFPSWEHLKSMPLAADFGRQFPLAFYINLASREDRRVEAEFQFAVQGMQVERMPAIIGKHVRNTRGHGNKSQYACRLSHRMAIRQAKARKAPCVLIFEDDVVLHPFFRDILERLTPPKDWGVLFFGCTHVKAPDVIEPGWVKVKYLWGLQAYVIKAEWYDKVLYALNRHGSETRQVGADIILSDLANEIPMYATYPNIAWQSEGYSDLMKTERQPFTKDGQQNRMLHVIRDVNEVMRHKIACEYGDDVVDEKKHHFLQPSDVYTAGKPVWSWEETFPLRLCINLEERIDRREQATMQFAKAQVDFDFFPAVDGRKKQNIADPGAYGCALSHILALRKAWNSGVEAVLITEDDVVLHKNLKVWAESIELPEDWGILYLGNQHKISPTVHSRGLVRIHGSQSTHAYAVRREWIPTVMKAMRHGLKTCRPCDMVLVDLHQIIPTYGFYPNLAWQRESYSNITNKTVRSFESDGVQCWQRDSITELDKSMREHIAK